MTKPRKNKYKVTVLYKDGGKLEIKTSISEDMASSFENDEKLSRYLIKRSGIGDSDFGFGFNDILAAVDAKRASLKLFQYAKPKQKEAISSVNEN